MAMSKSKAGKYAWIAGHFRAAIENAERLFAVINLSAQGIATITAIPGALKVLEKIDSVLGLATQEENAASQLAERERSAALAKAEMDRGFSTVFALGTQAVWSWLESAVMDFVVLWIERRPSCLRTLKAPKVRVNLAEYEQLRGRQRARFIVDMIDRDIGGPLRHGLGRFDGLLDAIGFAVPVDENERRTLFELQQVRNCLAHRFGIVDARLVTACPWLKLKKGQPLSLTRADFVRYNDASVHFLMKLLLEVGDASGINLRSPDDEAPADKRAEKSRASDGEAQT